MRFRPSFFPFTEPSLEVDIQCRRDKGEIRFGEGDDWLEILGCGMVHPNVLRNCGLDPGRISRLCLGHGHRPHRHAQIRHAGSARLLRGRRPLALPLRLPPARFPDAGGGIERVIPRDHDEIHPRLAQGASRHRSAARRDRRQADHDRARGRAHRGQGQAACAVRHRARGRGEAASQRRPAARLHGRYRRAAIRSRSCAARRTRAPA